MTSSHTHPAARPRVGRPRIFAVDDLLVAATLVFRERGFHATSIGDLSAATGLAVGSIYKAFKDKRALFRAVFDRYVDERNDELQRLLGQSTLARDKVEVLLRFYARSSQGQEGSYGCLVVGSVATLSTLDADMARHVRTTVRRLEARLRQLLRQGQVDCSIPRHLDIKSTATMLMAMVQGFRVLGKTCRTGREMQRVVDQLMSLLA